VAKKEPETSASVERLIELMQSEEARAMLKELSEAAPPLEILAEEEVEDIQRAGKILAAKAEAYYLGYLRGKPVPGGEVADAGVTIVAAVTGSTVGTVVGQIVGKKLDLAVNVRERAVNPEAFGVKTETQL
jgi:hypothetical protein